MADKTNAFSTRHVKGDTSESLDGTESFFDAVQRNERGLRIHPMMTLFL
jgi:hypothetical protein